LKIPAGEIISEEAAAFQFSLILEYPGEGIENEFFRAGKRFAISWVEMLSATQFPPPPEPGQPQVRKRVDLWCNNRQAWSGLWISQMPVEIEDRQVASNQGLDSITQRMMRRRFVAEHPRRHENKLFLRSENRA
jgi:hypothetical protein